MKKILFAVMAFGALVACTNEEVIEIDREAIEFADGFVNNGTRALYSTTDKPQAFNVWGGIRGVGANANTSASVFTNAPVAETNGVWACSNSSDVQYWIYGATYNFAAVVDANGDVTTNAAQLPATIAFTNNEDGNTDLLYAEATGVSREKGTTAAPVPFTFDHLLSKVNVNVSNSTALDTYGFKVKALSFNSATDGVYTVADKKWATDDTELAMPFTFADAEIKGNADANCSVEKLVIPHTYAAEDLVVNVTVDWYYNGILVKTDDTFTVKNANEVTLAPGKAYNFKFEYGVDEQITFTVEKVNDWDSNNGDVTLN